MLNGSSSICELARLLGHVTGGRPAERLLHRFFIPQSDDTVVRIVKRGAAIRIKPALRVVGIGSDHRQSPRRGHLHRRDQHPVVSNSHPHNQSCPLPKHRGHDQSLNTYNHTTCPDGLQVTLTGARQSLDTRSTDPHPPAGRHGRVRAAAELVNEDGAERGGIWEP